MTKLTENLKDELNTNNQCESWLGLVISEFNDWVIDLLDNRDTESKKKFIFKLKVLLKYNICKKNITNSFQAFIDRYIIGEIVSKKINIDLSKVRYKIEFLRKNQLIHVNNFNLHKLNYEISSYIDKPINIKDIESLQTNLIIHINKLTLFLKKFSAYLWNDIFSDKKQLILDENTFTLNGMDLLFDALFVIYSYKKLNSELLEHIKNIMEIIYIMQKVLVYINTSSLLMQTNWTNSLNNEQENGVSWLFGLLRYLINKENELSTSSIEKKFLLNITWLDLINNDSCKCFWDSIIIDDIKNIEEKRRNKLISALLVGPKFLLKLKKLDNPLYNYIKLSDETTLEKVIIFFKTNKIEFTQEHFLFIFENNLFESKIVTKKEWLEKAKIFFDKWIFIEDIKKINCEQFETLSLENETINVKNLVNLFLTDLDKHSEYQMFLEEKEFLKEKLKLIHKSVWGYEELSELSNSNFFIFSSTNEYIQKINQLFIDNDLYNIYERNNKLLAWEKDRLDELDELYLIFKGLDDRTLGKLLFKIFKLSLDEIIYIKRFFSKFKGEKKDYDYILNNKFILNILKNKEFIDMYIEDEKSYSLTYIIWEIKKEISSQKTNYFLDKKNNTTQLELSEDDIYLNDRFKNNDELEAVKRILYWLNWYKKIFITWIKTKKQINYNQLKNIYDLINFFTTRWIKSFKNIKIYFKLAYDLWDDSNWIEFIHKTFRDINEFNNVSEIKNVIKTYLKSKEGKIILDYFDRIIKLSHIKANNLFDNILANFFKEWNIEKMNQMWQEFNQIIQNIYEWLNPKWLSSTKNNDSWKWTWTSAYIFRKIYIEELLFREWSENYSDYFMRLVLINWREVADSMLPDELNRKLFKNAYNSSLDENYMFFEALSEFSSVIQRFQNDNDKIEISNLQNKFNSLLNDWVKKFRKKYLIENW